MHSAAPSNAARAVDRMPTALLLSRYGSPGMEYFKNAVVFPAAGRWLTIVTIDRAHGANGKVDNWFNIFHLCTFIADAIITVTFEGEPYSTNVSEEQLLLRRLRMDRTLLSAFLEGQGTDARVSRRYAKSFDARLFVGSVGAPARLRAHRFGLSLHLNDQRLGGTGTFGAVNDFAKRIHEEINMREAAFKQADMPSMMVRDRLRALICRDAVVTGCLTVRSGRLSTSPNLDLEDPALEVTSRILIRHPASLARHAHPPDTPAGRALHGFGYFSPWAFAHRAFDSALNRTCWRSPLANLPLFVLTWFAALLVWPLWYGRIRFVISRLSRKQG